MALSIYSKKTESLRRRLQSSRPQGLAIEAPSPTVFTVTAADGESIEIPLAYLSDVAAIEVVGEAPDRSGPIEFHYTVHINNSAKLDSIGQHKLNRLAVEDEMGHGASAVKGKIYDNVADNVMAQSGLQNKLAGNIRNKVHNPLHKAASNVGRKLGVSSTSTTRVVNYVSKKVADATAKKVISGAIGAGLDFIFGKGIGLISMIVEADEIGYSAVHYGDSKERRFPVIFLIEGKPREA